MEVNYEESRTISHCLIKAGANDLIFGKKTVKVGLHNMWCQGAENKRDPPRLFNIVLQSHTVIKLAYHQINIGSTTVVVEVVNLSPDSVISILNTTHFHHIRANSSRPT